MNGPDLFNVEIDLTDKRGTVLHSETLTGVPESWTAQDKLYSDKSGVLAAYALTESKAAIVGGQPVYKLTYGPAVKEIENWQILLAVGLGFIVLLVCFLFYFAPVFWIGVTSYYAGLLWVFGVVIFMVVLAGRNRSPTPGQFIKASALLIPAILFPVVVFYEEMMAPWGGVKVFNALFGSGEITAEFTFVQVGEHVLSSAEAIRSWAVLLLPYTSAALLMLGNGTASKALDKVTPKAKD